jgi:enoyl-CoA hydratase/carnithine racemase
LSHSNNIEAGFTLREDSGVLFLTLVSTDGMNRLTHRKITAITDQLEQWINPKRPALPLLISGDPIFSAGADLNEIHNLSGPAALDFAQTGQRLMNLIANYPAPVCASISGFCMGGGLDLALACHRRIASPEAVFGHRGAALGLLTGWGGTQRLPRLIGKARALQMFIVAEKIDATGALRIGLIDKIADDPNAAAICELNARP